MKFLILTIAVAMLSGCAGTPPISAQELATITRDNNASVGCATGTGPWGRAGVVYVNAEHSTAASGRVTVNTDCSVTMEANQPTPGK